MSNLTAHQKDKLMADLRVVVADAEELLRITAGEMGEGATSLRARLEERLSETRHRLLDLQSSAADSALAAGRAADDYVHDNPWRSIAIGAAVGLVVGMLIGRR